jgi:hypothetical protein
MVARLLRSIVAGIGPLYLPPSWRESRIRESAEVPRPYLMHIKSTTTILVNMDIQNQ